jgi:hypothetical protein
MCMAFDTTNFTLITIRKKIIAVALQKTVEYVRRSRASIRNLETLEPPKYLMSYLCTFYTEH